ncbi:MAG: Holliday junction resolvase RuvX [Acidobacteria bacterium]|nr:Holliday junction resolvase RuvX [Acidobacteriota bacterium]
MSAGEGREAPGRTLAVDWGRRRIGLAVSDELGLTVRGLPTVEHIHREADLAAIEDVARRLEARRLLVGRPVHLDGRAGASSREAARFGKALAKRCGLELILWDERLTSVEAGERLREARPGTRVEKPAVDRMAAQILLEDYLRAQDAACDASS